MSKNMKSASIYLKDGVIRIISKAKTLEGAIMEEKPVFFLQETDPFEAIGQKTLEALSLFGKVIPYPKNQEAWKARQLEWCKSMKIKSWRTFAKGTKSLDIEMDNNNIIITPLKNMGSKEGFDWLENKSRPAPTDPEKLGRAILEAFDDCE